MEPTSNQTTGQETYAQNLPRNDRSEAGASDGVKVLSGRRCTGVHDWLLSLRGLPGKAKNGELSARARLLMLLIANFEVAFFSVAYAADMLGCTLSTARDAAAELEDAGAIERQRGDSAKGFNTYVVLMTPAGLAASTPPELRRQKRQLKRPQEIQTEIKAASAGAAPPPSVQSEMPEIPESELWRRLDEAANRLEPEPPKREEAGEGKVQPKPARRPRVPKKSADPMPVEQRNVPLPLTEKQLVEMRRLPHGHSALERLHQLLVKGVHPAERIQNAVKRTLAYGPSIVKTGHDFSALCFVQHVLKGDKIRDDEAELAKREEQAEREERKQYAETPSPFDDAPPPGDDDAPDESDEYPGDHSEPPAREERATIPGPRKCGASSDREKRQRERMAENLAKVDAVRQRFEEIVKMNAG